MELDRSVGGDLPPVDDLAIAHSAVAPTVPTLTTGCVQPSIRALISDRSGAIAAILSMFTKGWSAMR